MSTHIATISKNSREKIIFSLNEFKGKNYLDMRVYLVGEDGSPDIPTRKGLTLALSLWPQFREALSQMEAAMLQMHLIDKEDLEAQG